MKNLIDEQCGVCRSDSVPVTEVDQKRYLLEIPEWRILSEQGRVKLSRSFIFTDFKAALAFTNDVGQLAETYQHHPEIHTQWGKVVVTWWTHSINGLHKNDFILAAKSDVLFVYV